MPNAAEKQALQTAVSTWLLEVSALLFVFPILDQLFDTRPFRWFLAAAGFGLSLTFGLLGLTLIKAS
jgi:hypothetical protein